MIRIMMRILKVPGYAGFISKTEVLAKLTIDYYLVINQPNY